MPSLRYLNTMLTVIAVLLTLHLWTLWTTGVSTSELAPLTPTAQAQGITDPGAQRKQIVDELKLLNVKTEALTNLLRSGAVRVKVEAVAKDKE